jgi:hypothetical protein
VTALPSPIVLALPGKHGAFGLTEVSRVGVRAYLTVGRGGIPPASFDIDSITGRRLPSGQPVITARVTSTRLTGGPGNTSSGPFPAQKTVTLAPGQSWNLTFAAPKSLPSGSWRATISLASGMTTATGTATVRFAPVVAAQPGQSPAQRIWLALGGLALVLVLVMGRYAWRRRPPSYADGRR